MKFHKLLVLFILGILFTTLTFNVYAVDNEKIEQTEYNNVSNKFYKCGVDKEGVALVDNIPKSIPKVTHIIYLVIEIAVPIILVIFGSIDLFKGLIAQKEDEIKKGQQTFIKRLITAGLIFMVFMIVKIIIGMVADSNKTQIVDCVDCFINKKKCIKQEIDDENN